MPYWSDGEGGTSRPYVTSPNRRWPVPAGPTDGDPAATGAHLRHLRLVRPNRRRHVLDDGSPYCRRHRNLPYR